MVFDFWCYNIWLPLLYGYALYLWVFIEGCAHSFADEPSGIGFTRQPSWQAADNEHSSFFYMRNGWRMSIGTQDIHGTCNVWRWWRWCWCEHDATNTGINNHENKNIKHSMSDSHISNKTNLAKLQSVRWSSYTFSYRDIIAQQHQFRR